MRTQSYCYKQTHLKQRIFLHLAHISEGKWIVPGLNFPTVERERDLEEKVQILQAEMQTNLRLRTESAEEVLRLKRVMENDEHLLIERDEALKDATTEVARLNQENKKLKQVIEIFQNDAKLFRNEITKLEDEKKRLFTENEGFVSRLLAIKDEQAKELNTKNEVVEKKKKIPQVRI